jgi:hypothetical protein
MALGKYFNQVEKVSCCKFSGSFDSNWMLKLLEAFLVGKRINSCDSYTAVSQARIDGCVNFSPFDTEFEYVLNLFNRLFFANI